MGARVDDGMASTVPRLGVDHVTVVPANYRAADEERDDADAGDRPSGEA